MKKVLVVEDDRSTRYLLSRVLKSAGYAVSTAPDGVAGLRRLRQAKFDLLLVDIWMPRLNGIEMLSQLPSPRPKAIVMTSDTTPETLLLAVREQAWQYLSKPVDPGKLVEMVRAALADSSVPPIEVLSARPDWVELMVPCALEAAERIQGFMARLDTDLPEQTREAVGQVFREMLMNAVEWGGRLDPNRKVRISCLRGRKMLLYRIADPGPGFNPEQLEHAAVGQPTDQPLAHIDVREQKGLRPGGFGILMARAMVDELLYNEAHNEVVFVKYLD